MVESHSTKGLIIISKLYQEGRIDDDQREQLKDMIFSEDAILMSLLERYDEEQDIKDAVLSYCNRGAVSSSASKRGGEPQKGSGTSGFSLMHQQQPAQDDASVAQSELDNASSPTDSALDFMKRKRLNQLAAKQKAEHSALGGGMQSQQQQQQPSAFGISDCDLGASPQMSKGPLFAGKMSPLAVQTRMLSINKGGNGGN